MTGLAISKFETEKYIIRMLSDSGPPFEHSGEYRSTKIEFRGTEVTVLQDSWFQDSSGLQSKRTRKVSSFNLKDLNPQKCTITRVSCCYARPREGHASKVNFIIRVILATWCKLFTRTRTAC
jgi:hypothetical protein